MSQKLTAEDRITQIDWVTKRITAMNRLLKKNNSRPFHEHFIDEHWRLMNTTCKTKAEYKKEGRKNGHQ